MIEFADFSMIIILRMTQTECHVLHCRGVKRWKWK